MNKILLTTFVLTVFGSLQLSAVHVSELGPDYPFPMDFHEVDGMVVMWIDSRYNPWPAVSININHPTLPKGGTHYVIPSTIEYENITYDVERVVDINMTPEIKSVEFPDQIWTINSCMFYDCNLESVIFPKSLETIMNACFSAVPHLKSVVFPEKLRTIEHSSFVNCRSLEEIVFPECNDKMYIGNSAFHGTNVKTLKLPNGLKSIEYYTFSGNYNLEELHLPQNDQLVIDISAFYNCPNLKIIYCPNIIPPTTDDQLYGYDYLEDPTRRFLTEFCSPDYYRNKHPIDKNTCRLMVPEGCAEIYRQSPAWRDFVHIEEYEAAGIEKPGTNTDDIDSIGDAEYYNLQGSRIANPTQGIYLKKINGVVHKVVVK